MNFFKRATTSILRRPGKTVILLLLVFILGSVIAGAISVEGAISNTDANLRRNMQPLVSIGMDWTEWWDYLDQYDFDWETTFPPLEPRLRPEDVRAMGALEYVDFFDYILGLGLRSFDLERPEYDGMSSSWGEGMPDFFNLSGTTNTELVHVDQEIISIVHGRQFEAHEQTPGSERVAAIVSEAFADLNNLSLNSVFTLSQWITNPDEWGNVEAWEPSAFEDENIYERVDLELEIVGIFELAPRDPDSNDQQEGWQRLERLSTIYVPNWAIEETMRNIDQAMVSSFENSDVEMAGWLSAQRPEEGEELEMRVIPLFVLEDPRDMDAFKEAVTPLLPSEFHRIEDLSSAFDDIASSMATMQSIADWILYVSIGATLLILSLLITLFLRDRRYEMGVYLALGEKKGKIVAQILMEVLVTSFVAITLSVFVGSLISGTVSRNMLLNELQADASDDNHWGMMRDHSVFDEIGIPTTNLSVDEMMAQFDVSLNMQTIGLFYIVGLGAVVLSTLAPVIYVVTLNPKKVLM